MVRNPMMRRSGPRLSGERVDEEQYQSDVVNYAIYLCHLATYDFARDLIAGGRVLDFGCGTGYGARRLSPECAEIVGVDIASEAIALATTRHGADNVVFRQIARVEEAGLPFDAASFDAVLSFQVIEHIDDPEIYLREVVRVLRPGGVVVFATPDRRTRLRPGQLPWNRFHVTEFDAASLLKLLGRHFDDVDLFTMTAEPEVLERELRRTLRLRRLAYPFTFPGVPQRWRDFGLRSMKAAAGIRKRMSPSPCGAVPEFGFDISAIRIKPGTAPGLNILAVARLR